MNKLLLLPIVMLGMISSSAAPLNERDSLIQSIPAMEDDSLKALRYGRVSWLLMTGHGDLDTAQMYIDSIADLSEKLDFRKGIMNSGYYRGVLYRLLGRYEVGIETLYRAIAMAEEAGDSSSVANFIFHIGVMHQFQGDYEKSLKALYRGVDIHQASGNKKGLAMLLNSVGIGHKDMGEYKRAIEVYERVIEVEKEVGDKMMLANATSNIGSAYFDMKEYDQAEKYFRQALELDIELETDWGIAYQYENLGTVASKKGELDTAIEMHRQSLGLRRKIGVKREIAYSLRAIGSAYSDAGQSDLGITYLDSALSIAKEIDAHLIEQEILGIRCDTYEANGDDKKALGDLRRMTTLKDSLMKAESLAELKKLETRYEVKEQQQANALLLSENERKDIQIENESNIRKGLIGGFILLAVIGGLLVTGQRRRIKAQKVLATKNEQINKKEFERSLTELELKALRAQMNPHFIFNCMNSINRLILEDENEQASRNLTKFSKLIRMILDHSEKKTVPLDEELEMLETYISLEAQRFKGRIDYAISVDPAIDTSDIELPSMILQPFIENAIWHGLMHKEGDDGRIDIRIEERGDMLHCIIEDNGVGREKALELKSRSAVTHKSMAMKVTEARLALLDKTGLGRLVEILDLKNEHGAVGTRVEVSIPLG